MKISLSLGAFALAALTSTAALAAFEWGGDCSSGDGSFDQGIAHYEITTIGEIPTGKNSVRVELTSDKDVDIQIIAEDGTEIVAWPGGLLNAAGEGCAEYRDVTYCYSGYDGVGGQKGNEYIEVRGTTNVGLTMRAFGYEAGNAEVAYSFSAPNTCNEKGDGSFSQYLRRRDSSHVGYVPAGKVNVGIELRSVGGRDLDVQVLDRASGTELVAWPDGIADGPTEETFTYEDMEFTYSGYNGINGDLGHEKVTISGTVTRELEIRAYAYQSGTATIDYEWGTGAGLACQGFVHPPLPACLPGLMCKDIAPMGRARDLPGQCHTENWCLSDAMAQENCAGLPHIATVGQWGCEEFECVWRTSTTGVCSTDANCPQGQVCEEGACSDPIACVFNGIIYEAGTTVSKPDGCNGCRCDERGRMACTKMYCGGGVTCTDGDRTVPRGARFLASDGCNTCTCGDNGLAACTKMACWDVACEYNGTTYEIGDTWDGLTPNSQCQCAQRGQVACQSW